MAEKEREIAGWITAFGNHIPIYTDDPNLSSYQDIWNREKQIKRNQDEARKLNSRGEGPGKYTVYRAGDLSGASTGMVYFAMDKTDADEYAKPSSFKMQGKTYKRPKREVKEYSLDIKKPLVIQGADDTECAEALYAELHPGKDFKKEAKKEGVKITGLNSMMLYLDKANSKALKNGKYDAIQYKTYSSRANGYVLSQIIVPADSDLLKGN